MLPQIVFLGSRFVYSNKHTFFAIINNFYDILAILAQLIPADIRSLMVETPDIETKEEKLRDHQPTGKLKIVSSRPFGLEDFCSGTKRQ